MRLCCKIWLENNGKAFGEGPCQLLQLVDSMGTLNKAAQKMNMSYSHAWRLINNTEKRVGYKLLSRQTGGVHGGGSEITPEARQLIMNYTAMTKEAEELLQRLYEKYF